MNDLPPNPGSDEALADGCQCPVSDNGHGRVAPYPKGGWIVDLSCPMHGHATATDNDIEGS